VPSPDAELPDFDALWNYDQPAETERAFQDMRQQTAETAPLAYRLELLTQIARTQGLQRRFDIAHATLDRVLAQLDAGSGEPDELFVPRIRYLLERGRVFNSSRQPDRARPLFLDAWQLASAHEADFHAVDAAHMLGIVEPGEEGLAWNLRALEAAERSAEPRARGWRGSLYNNMGWSYHDAGEYERALEMFESALACWEEEGLAKEARVARWAVARTLRSLGRVDEALDRQLGVLREVDAAGASDGYAREEIGECLLALGRGEEARPHFARAYEVLSADPWLAEAESARLERLRALAVDASGMLDRKGEGR
jgi:tetratricopeptide (TPR) repeat protein